MTRAHDPLAVDEAVADAAAVVRAHVVDDDERAAAQASHRDGASSVARSHDCADRNVAELRELAPAIVGVVPELVEELRPSHAPRYAAGLTAGQVRGILDLARGSLYLRRTVASVLVHIDLEAGTPDPSSLVALAAGRALATSWGASLTAGVIVPAPAGSLTAIERALGRAGADRIIVAPTRGVVVPLWEVLGGAWQGVLDELRPRLVLFGADAPSAPELAPRTAARIGARLLVRARSLDDVDEAVLRDRDGGHARSGDGGATVALIGRAVPQPHSDHRVALLVLPAADASSRVEVVGTAPAEIAHARGPLVALASEVASDPVVVAGAERLAALVGGQLIKLGSGVERFTPLSPELCVIVGGAQLDVAGATSVIKIGANGGKLVDGALPGSPGAGLAELVERLERTQ